MNDNTNITVALLAVFLVLLIVLLVYLYKRLNQETNGRYTVHQMIYGKRGAVEHLNNWARTFESHLGVHLWPCNAAETEGEEEELKRQDQEEDRQESDVEQGAEEDKKNRAEDDSSDDYSSMEGVDLQERAKQMQDQDEEKEQDEKEKEEKMEEKEKEWGQDGKGASGGGGILVDLEPLSGTVIWEDEKKQEESTDGNVDLTAL